MAADSNSARFTTFAGEPLTAGDLVKIGYEGTAIRCTHADRPEGIVLENAHTGNEVLIHDISSGPSSTSAASTPTPSVADLIAAINGGATSPAPRPISEFVNRQLGRPFGNTSRPPRPRPWNGDSTPAAPTGPPQPSISEMLRMMERDQWPLLPPTIAISMSEHAFQISGSEPRHPIRRLHDGLRHFGYDFHLDHDHSTGTTHFRFTKDRALHQRALNAFYGHSSNTRERDLDDQDYQFIPPMISQARIDRHMRAVIQATGISPEFLQPPTMASSARTATEAFRRMAEALGPQSAPNPPLTVAPPAPKTLSYPVQNRRKITA